VVVEVDEGDRKIRVHAQNPRAHGGKRRKSTAMIRGGREKGEMLTPGCHVHLAVIFLYCL
jgi:hypothetical protein